MLFLIKQDLSEGKMINFLRVITSHYPTETKSQTNRQQNLTRIIVVVIVVVMMMKVMTFLKATLNLLSTSKCRLAPW